MAITSYLLRNKFEEPGNALSKFGYSQSLAQRYKNCRTPSKSLLVACKKKDNLQHDKYAMIFYICMKSETAKRTFQ
uniref:Uncharacterized protein n=1 Tax=Globodera rostochiensis TaxID=31243 RepID=A0A914HUV7_GLORO